jgi:hypothetical protein
VSQCARGVCPVVRVPSTVRLLPAIELGRYHAEAREYPTCGELGARGEGHHEIDKGVAEIRHGDLVAEVPPQDRGRLLSRELSRLLAVASVRLTHELLLAPTASCGGW